MKSPIYFNKKISSPEAQPLKGANFGGGLQEKEYRQIEPQQPIDHRW